MEAFALLDVNASRSLRSELAKVLVRSLDSATPQVRRFAAYLAGDFLQQVRDWRGEKLALI